MRATLRDEEVFTLSADGNVTATSLGTMDGAFRVGDGLLHARDIAVEASLTVGGAAHVEDSLTLGSGFVLNPEGMTIDANRHSHALLELKSGATDFDSALLEIKASAQQASFIKGTVNGVTTFDLAASGDLQLNHIRLLSGGVHVSSGGVQVDAGGVMVQGGLTVASGGVSFLEGSVAASSISVQRGAESVDASALIAAGSSSASFVGTMLELSGAGAGEKGFTFIHATKKSGNDAGDDVFIVSSEGSVMAKGDMSVGGRFRSASGAVLEADVTLTKTTVSAGEVSVYCEYNVIIF